MLFSVAACGGAPRPTTQTAVAPVLPPAPSADPTAPGAAYLASVEQRLAPAWQQFLTDCRNKLPADHPLNAMRLQVQIALTIDANGKVLRRDTLSSGVPNFDSVAEAIVDENLQLPPPPAEQRSDDGTVRVEWLFARDRRRATAATARVVIMEAPARVALAGMIARGQFARAAGRMASASDADSVAATEPLVTAIVHRAISSTDTETVRTAVAAMLDRNASNAPDVQKLASANREELWPLLYRFKAASFVPVVQQRLVAHPEELALALPHVTAGSTAVWASTVKQLQQRKLWGHAFAIEAASDATRVVLPDDKVVLRSLPATRGMACWGYIAVAPTRRAAWQRVYEALQDGSATVRRDCARALNSAAPLGAPASVTKTLRTMLDDGDDQVAAAAVDAAAAQGVAVSSKVVTGLAQHRSVAVRSAVAHQRGWLQAGSNAAALTALRNDREPAVRAQLASTSAAGQALLADPDANVRAAAARAVVDPTQLTPLLTDSQANVRYEAQRTQALKLGAGVRPQVLRNIAAASDGSLAQVQAAAVYFAVLPSK